MRGGGIRVRFGVVFFALYADWISGRRFIWVFGVWLDQGEEKGRGGDRKWERDLCPSEGTGARGTRGDPAGPAASAAATAEAEESAARARAAGAPPASLPSQLTAGND